MIHEVHGGGINMLEVAIITFFCGMCGGIAICMMLVRAAYANGLVDGYSYSREPNNPLYDDAGDYLKKKLAYRYPELNHRRYRNEFHEYWRDN